MKKAIILLLFFPFLLNAQSATFEQKGDTLIVNIEDVPSWAKHIKPVVWMQDTAQIDFDDIPDVEYDYFYFSQDAYEMTKRNIIYGRTPSNHSTVNGREFTLWITENYKDFFKNEYLKSFPDTVLVMKLPKDTGKILIHY